MQNHEAKKSSVHAGKLPPGSGYVLLDTVPLAMVHDRHTSSVSLTMFRRDQRPLSYRLRIPSMMIACNAYILRRSIVLDGDEITSLKHACRA